MIRFANAMRALESVPRSTNPSGSGFAIQRKLETFGAKLAGLLGFASTGSATAGAGIAGAGKAPSSGRNMVGAVQATQPLRLPAPSSAALAVEAGELGSAHGAPMLPFGGRR